MHDGKFLRVLLVEDSEDDALLVLEALRGEYGEVHHLCVETAQALRAALDLAKWDVIVCDHELPALDAPSALKIVQEKRPDIPFIIVSGHIGEEVVVAAMMAGAADAISKRELSRLVPAVEREMRKSFTVVELKKAHEQIELAAYYDALTGLPNREHLSRRMEDMLGRNPPPESMAMLVININRFRQIPRTLGIQLSNLALQTIGGRIMGSVWDVGIAARLEGDRFAVLLPENAGSDVVDATIRMLTEKLGEAMNIDGQEFFLSCSVGVSIYPQDGKDFGELLVSAETAMYRASSESGSNYRFFEADMLVSGQEQLVLESALHRAIKQDEFRLHYQPQIDLHTGRIIGVEALVRWEHPENGLISPTKFIPLLEETGLILPVGEWVLRTACAQNLAWQRAGLPPIRVAVNLSAIQFQQADLVGMVQRVLKETGLEPRYLELEITENIAMHNEETTIAVLGELRGMGITLSIDDFGTGYSSLSYLRHFPVHKLKIDRSFVKDIAEGDNGGGSIVRAIVSLAHNMGLGVIAEGVETLAQSAFLHACGCREVQGYLFGVPMPHHEIGGFFDRLPCAAPKPQTA